MILLKCFQILFALQIQVLLILTLPQIEHILNSLVDFIASIFVFKILFEFWSPFLKGKLLNDL